MARAKSVILTPAEKKEAITSTKDSLKTHKSKVSELTKNRAAAVKAHEAKVKELTKAHEKAVGELNKLHNAEVKALDKDLKAATTDFNKAQADYDKLVPPAVNTGNLVDTGAGAATPAAVAAIPTPTTPV